MFGSAKSWRDTAGSSLGVASRIVAAVYRLKTTSEKTEAIEEIPVIHLETLGLLGFLLSCRLDPNRSAPSLLSPWLIGPWEIAEGLDNRWLQEAPPSGVVLSEILWEMTC